jgi:hypothetical protein
VNKGAAAERPWVVAYSLKMVHGVWAADDARGLAKHEFSVRIRTTPIRLRAPTREARDVWITTLARCCRLLPGRR